MAESEEELSLEFTDEDEKRIRALVEQHLGINSTKEKDLRNSGNIIVSDLQTDENDLKSSIKSTKKAIIEEVFSEFFNNYSYNIGSSIKVLPNQYLSSDTLRAQENLQLEKDSMSVRAEEDCKTNAELKSELLIFSPVSSQDFTGGEQVKNTPDIMEDTILEEDVETNKIKSFSKSNQLNSIETLSDDPHEGFITNNNNNNFEVDLKKTEERCDQYYKDLRDSQELKIITKLSMVAGKSISPLECKSMSRYQLKLTEKIIVPLSCIYELCQKGFLPMPRFSISYIKNKGLTANIHIGDTVFKSENWAKCKKQAKQLAAVAFLEWLGFDCPDEEVEKNKSSPTIIDNALNRTSKDRFQKNKGPGENLVKDEESCKSKCKDISLQTSAFENILWDPSTVENLRFPLDSSILSLYQSKLTKNQLCPRSCLDILCAKSSWPNPTFSLVEQHQYRGFIFQVSIKGKVFAEGHTWGRSTKIAKQLASAACLRRFGVECPLTVFGPKQSSNVNGVTCMDKERDSGIKDGEVKNNTCETKKYRICDSQNDNFGGTRYSYNTTNVNRKRKIPNDKFEGQCNKEETEEHRHSTSNTRLYFDLRTKLNMNKRKTTQNKPAEGNHSVKHRKLS